MLIEHHIKFNRSRLNPERWRALCSCGWYAAGEEEDVKNQASGHDLDWQSDPPGTFELGLLLHSITSTFELLRQMLTIRRLPLTASDAQDLVALRDKINDLIGVDANNRMQG